MKPRREPFGFLMVPEAEERREVGTETDREGAPNEGNELLRLSLLVDCLNVE